MRWFRSNRRVCGQLALFALALQIALSFGHIHPEELAVPSTDRGSADAVANSPLEGLGSLPAPNDYDGLADDHCAICATIALVGSLVLPEAPAVLLPSVKRPALAPQRVAVLAPDHRRPQFQARAPPA